MCMSFRQPTRRLAIASAIVLLYCGGLWYYNLNTHPYVRLVKFIELFNRKKARRVPEAFIFHRLSTDKALVVVSAYWQQSGDNVRVFLLKEYTSQPRINCSFESGERQVKRWLPSHDCKGNNYRMQGWNEFKATTVGRLICCRSRGLNHGAKQILHLAAQTDQSPSTNHIVSLPIGRALPILSNKTEFPYKFAVCIAPMFDMRQYSSKYLVDFLEMHRAIGAELFIIYLSYLPPPEVKRVLDSYEAQASLGEMSKFKVILMHWYLDAFVNPNATHSRTQIIAFNDCLYRFGHHSEFFVMSDLDELVVPKPRFGYSWLNMVQGLEELAGKEFPVACSCGLRLWFCPLNEITNKSVFYADRTTWETSKYFRKCIVRSGRVSLYHVHQALEPGRFYKSDDIFTLYHYRLCKFNCTPGTSSVQTHQYVWPLRQRIQQSVDSRLDYIVDNSGR